MQPQILQLVEYNDPILRKVTAKVKFPLSIEDLQIVSEMLFSIMPEQLEAAQAAFASAAGMAANQWGIDRSIFLYCPAGSKSGKVEVVINPSYEPIDTAQAEEWEGCFSIPNASGRIKRYEKIKIKYQDIAGNKIVKELSGWEARVWQHETDHLNGLLYDDAKSGKCQEKFCFNTDQELDEFYKRIKSERNPQ